MAQGYNNSHKGLPGQLSLIDGCDDARAADFLSTPYRLVEQLLKARTDLADEYAVEPCAGNGALIRHSLTAASRLKQLSIFWTTAVELRDESASLWQSTDTVTVYSPQDVTTLDAPPLDGVNVTLALTNLPWFDGVIPVCKAVWRLWPNAHLWGLCSTFFYLNTIKERRADWMAEHRPEDIYHVPDRVAFEGESSTYNQPVAWHHWLPGGVSGAGHWHMLPSWRPSTRDVKP